MLKNKATVHFHIHYQDKKQAYGEKVFMSACVHVWWYVLVYQSNRP